MRTSRLAMAIGASAALAAAVLVPVIANAAAGDEPGATALPRYDHVVVVMYENKNYPDIASGSDAPYFQELAGQGALFTQSFGVTHPSQPNYIALFSGDQQGVDDDSCPHSFSTASLGNQVLDAGLTFSGYAESLPETGSDTCSDNAYARKHAPWTNFAIDPSLQKTFNDFPTDFSQLPTVSFVIPNMCSDMHDCSISTGDSWQQAHLDAYAQWAKANNSLLITTFDEDNFTSVNQIYTSFVGAHVKVGSNDQQINHYTVLRTIEDMYGLAPLGHAADEQAITSVFDTAVGSPVAIANPGTRTGHVGAATGVMPSARGGTGFVWAASGLPAGLRIDPATGAVSGTPRTPGTYTVTLTAKARDGQTGTATFRWTIA
jgi:hypothetical protein